MEGLNTVGAENRKRKRASKQAVAAMITTTKIQNFIMNQILFNTRSSSSLLLKKNSTEKYTSGQTFKN